MSVPHKLKAKVIYKDGRIVEAVIGPRAQVEVERKFPELDEFIDVFDETRSNLTKVYFMCWAAVHYAGLEKEADFDAWLDSIVDAEPVTDRAAKVDPTERAPKPASTADSPS